VTRPVPEEQRQALLRQVADQDATERARVELEDALAAAQADARSWRMIAGFALAAALIAAAVAVFALVRWHAAQSALTACRPAVAADKIP
jgi:type VI protein secretion system component VasF